MPPSATDRPERSSIDAARARSKTDRPWHHHQRKKRRCTAVVVPTLIILCLSGCQDELTANGTPYDITVNGTSFTVTNTAAGTNEREALIPSSEPVESDSASCATWDSGDTPAQNGIVFRGVSDSGGWDGVVIERSFYEGPPDGYFIVIYYHAGTFDIGPSIDLSSYFGQNPLWPTSMCAVITSDDVLSFAVAQGSDPMVPPGTPGRGATFTLDSADVPPSGQTGTYVAHLSSGDSLEISDVTIDGAPAPSPLS